MERKWCQRKQTKEDRENGRMLYQMKVRGSALQCIKQE